jgi:hypothetical protein
MRALNSITPDVFVLSWYQMLYYTYLCIYQCLGFALRVMTSKHAFPEDELIGSRQVFLLHVGVLTGHFLNYSSPRLKALPTLRTSLSKASPHYFRFIFFLSIQDPTNTSD